MRHPLFILAGCLALTSAAQLGPEHRFIYPSTGTALAVYDVDGDGDGDVLRATEAGLLLSEQVAPASFQVTRVLAPESGAYHLDIHDLDGDGLDDILVPDREAQGVQWLRATGGGNYAPPALLLSGLDDILDVSAADLDNDGQQDLIYTERSGDTCSVAWAAGQGGSFATPVALATFATAPWDPTRDRLFALGDIDGDGDTDVLFGQPAPYWLRNDGSGSFTSMPNNGSIDHAQPVLADVDGDDDLDSWSVEYHGPFYLQLNNGDGTFTAAQEVFNLIGQFGSAYDHSLVVADRDADGDPDLFVHYWWGDIASTDEVIALMNDGTGGLSLGADMYGSDEPQPFAVGDLDNDGRADVVACMNDVTNAYFVGSNEPVLMTSLAKPQQLTVVDHDVVVSGQLYWSPLAEGVRPVQAVRHSNTGNSIDQHPAVLWNGAAPIERTDAADMNGDGTLDLVLQWMEPLSGTWRHPFWMDGTDSVAPVGGQFFPFFFQPVSAPVYADLDNDGDVDMARYVHWPLTVALNDGTGHFGAEQEHMVQIDHPVMGLALVDADGDGDKDFVWAANIDYGIDSLAWMANDGAGAPAGPIHLAALPMRINNAPYTASPSLRAWDMDLDGRMDVVAFSGDSLCILHNTGNGFAVAQALPCGTQTYALGDINGDTFPDLVTLRRDGALSTRLGTGDGTLGPLIPLQAGGGPALVRDIALCDVDQDGRQDLVICAENGYAAWMSCDLTVGVQGSGDPKPGLTIAPNPAEASFTIQRQQPFSGDERIDLCDAHGRVVRTLRGNGGTTLRVERGDLAAGLYVLRVEQNGAVIAAQRIILR